jgi:hypothetical protein
MYKFCTFLSILCIALAGCQAPEQDTVATEIETIANATPETQPRPKPEFYNIKGIEKKRVFICMDGSEDTFHVKHDCPLLVACKTTFRNLTLGRAVEDFDRYNCDTCSSDLAYIFDENNASFETGLGSR